MFLQFSIVGFAQKDFTHDAETAYKSEQFYAAIDLYKKAYAKEKDCQFLASLLNMLIGEICATKFVFDTKLVIQIAPFCNFGDGKFMWLASGLSGGSSDHSCWMCEFPKSDWGIGADVSSSRKTVADQGRSYLRALFSTLNAMLSTQLNGVTSARKLLKSACAQVGCGQQRTLSV